MLRFNDKRFMIKALRKAIMHRSKLKNVFHKTRAKKDRNNYKKQRNFCINQLIYPKWMFSRRIESCRSYPNLKKNDDLDKENYRSVSVLPHVSKIIKRVMYIQIENFMEDKFSKLPTGFRKNHSIQHCLVNMLGKWKNTLDKGGFVCAIFMDLSKAFDTSNYDLLIAKVGAYGFQEDAPVFMKSYFTNRQQRVSVKSNISMWEKINSGVPQGSVLGPLRVSIFFK